jgi:hypothetical protein
MNPSPFPQVDMGATVCYHSDSHAYTVIAVSSSGKKLSLQRDNAKRKDNNGMSECQEYVYSPNPNGNIIQVSLRKDLKFRVVKSSILVLLGVRKEYYDYSF